MPLIELHTYIEAPVERCFLLSLSVDLHKASAGATGERIVDGVREGIMKEGDTVTWRARHFGITQDLTSVVHSLRPPHYFVDDMTRGAFKKLHHEHRFERDSSGTLM